MPTFTTELLRTGGNNVGIQLSDEIIAELGGGRRPPVRVLLGGYEYRTTVGVMRGMSLIPVNAATRAAAGVAGGEVHEITVELDTAPREVVVPDDFAAALSAAGLRDAFDALAPSHRKEHVRAIEEAKAAETRQRRIAKAIEKIGG